MSQLTGRINLALIIFKVFFINRTNFELHEQLLDAFFYMQLASSSPKSISLVENDLAR